MYSLGLVLNSTFTAFYRYFNCKTKLRHNVVLLINTAGTIVLVQCAIHNIKSQTISFLSTFASNSKKTFAEYKTSMLSKSETLYRGVKCYEKCVTLISRLYSRQSAYDTFHDFVNICEASPAN